MTLATSSTDLVTEHRQALDTLDVTVVLPCLNEQQSVGRCVLQAKKALTDAGFNGEVIVVDNNSTDDSASVATAAGARVVFERREGYGSALAAGIREAKGNVVVMADADCTYPLELLAELVQPVMNKSLDLVLGGRLRSADHKTMPWLHRLFGTPLLTYLLRQGAGGLPISDSQSGFRAFRRATIMDLDLRAPGMEFASEMLIRAGQRDLRIGEVALGYRPRVGESKLVAWRDGVRHLRLIFSLNPHLVMWQAGVAMTLLGLGLTIGAAIQPKGFHVGSIVWQPVYLSAILLVLGLMAALSGALVALHSPSSPPRVRRMFSWVAERHFHRLAKRCALVLGCGGAGLEVALALVWLNVNARSFPQQSVLAGLAQAMIIGSAILLAFSVGYPWLRGLDQETRGRADGMEPNGHGHRARAR
jgi:glycosyltransferase involved in cell wall biosynthesis